MRNNSRKDLVKLKEWLKVVEFGVSAEALSKSRGASTSQPKVQSSDWIALCRLTAEVRNVGILCKRGSAVRIKDKEVSIGTSCNLSLVDQKWKWLDHDICQCWEELIVYWNSMGFKESLRAQGWVAEPEASSVVDEEDYLESQFEGCPSPVTIWQLHDISRSVHKGKKTSIGGGVGRREGS